MKLSLHPVRLRIEANEFEGAGRESVSTRDILSSISSPTPPNHTPMKTSWHLLSLVGYTLGKDERKFSTNFMILFRIEIYIRN